MDLSERYKLKNFLDWSYGGVNGTIPGNGGPDCANFLSFERRVFETVLGCILALGYCFWGYQNITYPTTFPFVR